VGLSVLAGAAGAFAVLGTLEMIAEFASLTFLWVVLAVALAGWVLRAQIGASTFLAGLILLLVGGVVASLFYYLAETRPFALVILLSLYLAVVGGAFFYARTRH
jgi:hypothetical protein